MKLTFLYYASNSYNSRAKVLDDSLRLHHPDSEVIRVIPDESQMQGNYILGMAKNRLKSALELLEKGHEAVCVIGADCQLFSRINIYTLRLEEVEDVDFYDVVIVPHVINTHPNRSWMAQLYTTGHANADFMIFTNRVNSKNILKWLIEVTEGHEPSNGIFYEQTWLSAIPFLFDAVHILRHPGYNVGYWDANDRDIKRNQFGSNNGQYGPEWTAMGTPLVMVQFSGFIEGNPMKMSRYSSELAKGDVIDLYRQYDDKLRGK
jgi:hypothetical protein